MVEEIIKATEAHWGKNKVDIEHSEHYMIVKVHYPSLTIENSTGQSHIIKDLYVKYGLDLNQGSQTVKLETHLQGMRATRSIEEWSSGYIHSHLPSNKNGWSSFSDFCMGKATNPLPALMNEMNMSMLVDEEWLDTYELFMMQLDTYVRWESLEGGPYRKIGQIALNDSDNKETKWLNTLTLTLDYIRRLDEPVIDYCHSGVNMVSLELTNKSLVRELCNKYTQEPGLIDDDGNHSPFIIEATNKKYKYWRGISETQRGLFLNTRFKGLRIKCHIERPPIENKHDNTFQQGVASNEEVAFVIKKIKVKLEQVITRLEIDQTDMVDLGTTSERRSEIYKKLNQRNEEASKHTKANGEYGYFAPIETPGTNSSEFTFSNSWHIA
jgi:hypothetical protein